MKIGSKYLPKVSNNFRTTHSGSKRAAATKEAEKPEEDLPPILHVNVPNDGAGADEETRDNGNQEDDGEQPGAGGSMSHRLSGTGPRSQ